MNSIAAKMVYMQTNSKELVSFFNKFMLNKQILENKLLLPAPACVKEKLQQKLKTYKSLLEYFVTRFDAARSTDSMIVTMLLIVSAKKWNQFMDCYNKANLVEPLEEFKCVIDDYNILCAEFN